MPFSYDGKTGHFADCVKHQMGKVNKRTGKKFTKSDAQAVCATIMRKQESGDSNFIYYQRPILVEHLQKGESSKVYITGNAIDAGISRNKVQYSEDLLRQAVTTLKNKPLLLNHGDEDVRNIVGKVVAADFDGTNVPFKAELDTGEADIIRKIEGGFINSVSIGAYCPDEKIMVDEEGIKHPQEIEFVELSLVPIPGIPNATISQVIHEKFEVNKMNEIEELKKQMESLREQNDSLLKKFKEQEEKEEEKPAEEEKKEDEPSEEAKKIEGLEKSLKNITEKIDKLDQSKGIVDVPVKEKKPEKQFVRERNKDGSVNFYPKNPELFY